MSKIEERQCSRCGNLENLNLVTLRYNDTDSAGRILLYCNSCRQRAKLRIGVNIAIEEVTPEIFLDLYRTKQTTSDPAIAVDIVFGESNSLLVREVERIFKLHDKKKESFEKIQNFTNK